MYFYFTYFCVFVKDFVFDKALFYVFLENYLVFLIFLKALKIYDKI